MSRRRVLLLACVLALASPSRPWAAGAPQSPGTSTPEQPPGIRIERADPGPAAERRRRLSAWRELYRTRLEGLRRESEGLFAALERSSLAASALHCERVLHSASKVDRRGLFSSSDIRLDRVLFGSLRRFEAGSAECLTGRYLEAYQLLHEAQAGLLWIDRRLVSRLRAPVPLLGLGE